MKKSPDEKTARDDHGEAGGPAPKHRQSHTQNESEERLKLQSRLSRIRHKVVVLSGKGGVGKSMVAVSLASALAQSGKRVGLLDVDVHGPSIPTMLGLEGSPIHGSEDGMLPVEVGGMKVMSLGLLLQDQDSAVIWRGPMKMKVINQFLTDVAWGDLDYLIIDSPPGTGDEPLSVCQLIGSLDGAVIVTTPQKVAAVDVRKSITFCRELNVPVLGVVENMSGFACPKCGEVTPILSSGGGKRIAEDMRVPFLGSIPIDPRIADACDSGRAHMLGEVAPAAAQVIQNIVRMIPGMEGTGATPKTTAVTTRSEDKHLRIAIPINDGKLSLHFGHCQHFALVDVDMSEKKILKREDLEAPAHEPGLLPPWLAERGARLIIAGGMGQRAQGLFNQHGIEVVVGASAETPEHLVSQYMAGALQSGENICDH
ncbi:MAG: P-loop NTPase [Candidatus Eisenbacteria bacterium]|nr:P-loop NTPase [Candidatus Eisenbacteria bacterium]